MIRIDIVWKNSGVHNGDRFSAVWMDVQIFTFFHLASPHFSFGLFCIVGYSLTNSFLQGGQGFLLGVHIFWRMGIEYKTLVSPTVC